MGQVSLEKPAATAGPAVRARQAARGLQDSFNTVSHFVGAVLGSFGLFRLLRSSEGDLRKILAFAVYGGTMIGVYISSTAFHLYNVTGRTRRLLRKLDHAAIYLFIAGTHTPLCLVSLNNEQGWFMLVTVWTLALGGIVFKIFYWHAPRWLSTLSYLILGWLALVFIWPLAEVLPPAAIAWLTAGGLAYTVGSVIYLTRRPNPFPGTFGHHELWHVLALLGSGCHFWLMYRYVA